MKPISKFNVGDIVEFRGVKRKIVATLKDGTYAWSYPDIPKSDFLSINSSDPYLQLWNKI